MAKHLASKRHKFLSRTENITRQSGRRRAWRKVVGLLAGTVVFCTTYALILPAITMESEAEVPHVHDINCYDAVLEEGEKILNCPALEEDALHQHNDDCYVTRQVQVDAGELTCSETDPDHTHTALCFGQWKLNCPYLWFVEDVTDLIDILPSADEIDAKISEFSANNDEKGEEAYYSDIASKIATVYYYYSQLKNWQKDLIPNADKLMELEYILSSTLNQSNNTNNVATVDTAETRDFITVNLYDYGDKINQLYTNHSFQFTYKSTTYITSTYPGFQWNGGANILSNTTYKRYETDHIDFGNSVITDFVYGSGADGMNGLSVNANSINRPGIVNKLGFAVINSADNYLSGNYGSANRPVGLSLYEKAADANGFILSNIADGDKVHHVLKPILTNEGYPAIAGRVYGQSLLEGTVLQSGAVITEPSLYYLFSENTEYTVDKVNTKSIDGLFQIDPVTGAYFYDSRKNHAQYNEETNSFDVYNQIITPNFLIYPFGNFLPFNDITQNNTSQNVGNLFGTDSNGYGGIQSYFGGKILGRLNGVENSTSEQKSSLVQLQTMLGKYRQSLVDNEKWTTQTALQAIQEYFAGNQSGAPDNPGDLNGDDLVALQTAMSKMYNIDYDIPTNFFFGMDMSMTLLMPKDGLTGNDNDGNDIPDYPMVFDFSGDDDVWVYIDGVLFLDLSGMHRHVGGKIDFKEGKVYYYELDTDGTGDVATTPYQTYTFADVLLSAYQYQYRTDLTNGTMTEADLKAKVNAVINPDTGTFYDYSSHTFKMFYMERGSGSSICRMNFNFPILKKNTLEVSKEVTSDVATVGNPDYYFNIIASDSKTLFVGPGSKTGVTKYKIKDADGNYIMDGDEPKEFDLAADPVYGAYGIFTLKAGQTAVFEGISENSGSYYVQELIKNDDNEQFEGITVNNGAGFGNTSGLQSTGVVEWSARSWYADKQEKDAEGKPIIGVHQASGKEYGPGGYVWHYYSSQNFDASVPQSFLFTNSVNEDKLTNITIGKELAPGSSADAQNTTFKFKVTLDGVPLTEGTRDQFSNADRLLIENGNSYILLKPGETVTISRILSGAVITLQEVDHAGYAVSYTDPNKSGMWPANYNTETGIYTGTIRADVAATITATNTPAQVNIPVWKFVTNPGSGAEQFKFVLQRVDADGNLIVQEGVAPEYLTLSGITTAAGAGGEFALAYTAESVFAGMDDSVESTTLYYKLYEATDDHYIANEDVYYIFAVTVTRSASGIEAKLASAERVTTSGETVTKTPIMEDGAIPDKAVSFTNTLVADFSISKEVTGDTDTTKYFRFIVTLDLNRADTQNQVVFAAHLHHLEGVAEDVAPFSYNQATGKWEMAFKMRGGETLVIHDIPYNVSWTVTEEALGTYTESGEGWELNTDFSYLTTIKVNGTTATVTDRTASGTLTQAGATVTVAYTNAATYVLPETGGMGTGAFTAVGFGLMLFSTAWLLYKRKRRREEAVSP